MMSERIDDDDDEIVAQIAADVAQQTLSESDGKQKAENRSGSNDYG